MVSESESGLLRPLLALQQQPIRGSDGPALQLPPACLTYALFSRFAVQTGQLSNCPPLVSPTRPRSAIDARVRIEARDLPLERALARVERGIVRKLEIIWLYALPGSAKRSNSGAWLAELQRAAV